MALINCPECNNQVSDKAYSCPQCGYPITAINTVTKMRRAQSKRKRLPNGFGRITEIKNGNLRNPFRAMKTSGFDDFGKPLGKIIGYFPTYNSAYEAIVNYNANPYDLDVDNITLEKLYEKWSDEYFKTLKSISSIRTVTSAWEYCGEIKNMKVIDVRARHLDGCIKNAKLPNNKEKYGKRSGQLASANTKGRMKSMFNLMFDYALFHELIDKNYARMFSLDNEIVAEKERNKNEHIPFTKNEIEVLWNNVNSIKFVDMILIGIYSGWRPQELATLKLSNVDLENNIMTAGMKTDAGKDRIVPINSKILELIRTNYELALNIKSEYLFNDLNGQQGTHLTYDKYRKRFDKTVKFLPMELQHRPHDTRHTFITLAKESNLDEYAIKMIVGHAIVDLTEKVYTHRDIEWLKTEMSKII